GARRNQGQLTGRDNTIGVARDNTDARQVDLALSGKLRRAQSRRQRDHGRQAVVTRKNPRRGDEFAEHVMHFCLAATGKEGEQPGARGKAMTLQRSLAVLHGAYAVEERMPDKTHSIASGGENFFFKRKHDCESIRARADLLYSAAPPCPDLRSYVVQH